MSKNGLQRESKLNIFFDSIDHELKLRNLSRRELAKHLGVPESSLSTAFARKSISLFQKENRLEKTAEFFNVPLWSLLSGRNFQDISIRDGALIHSGDRPDLLLGPEAVTRLVREPSMATLVDLLLRDDDSWSFFVAVGDAVIAAKQNEDERYHAAMHKAHRLFDTFMDRIKT